MFDINIEVKPGSLTAIVGPNGAGKTTLLNSIYGFADIYSGSIIFNEVDITKIKPYKKALMGLAYVPQMFNIFSNLTVYENLTLAGYKLSDRELKDKIDQVIELFPRLGELINRKAGTLSGGERRMLAVAVGLMKNPKIMLLDEITTDLAPILVKRVLDKIVELRDKLGLTIILVEQHAKKALEISDKAYLLASGTIRYEGSPQGLLENKELAKLYLGL